MGRKVRSQFMAAITLCLAGACTYPSNLSSNTSPTSQEISVGTGTSSTVVRNQPRILSAYHGLDELPFIASVACLTGVTGKDGMPIVFSLQIDPDSVAAEAFMVETATGKKLTPVCATLRPAMEEREQRTVLLAGDFGTPQASPRAVEVVGPLKSRNGVVLQGLRTEQITPLSAGPKLVLAERFLPNTPGLEGECPETTKQIVQLTWDGGVSGPDGADLDEAQRTGVTVKLKNGQTITPIALADDDPDNHVYLCLDVKTAPVSITIAKGLFHDPGDDSNLETSIATIQPYP